MSLGYSRIQAESPMLLGNFQKNRCKVAINYSSNLWEVKYRRLFDASFWLNRQKRIQALCGNARTISLRILWRPITEPSGDWPTEDASTQKLEPDVRKNKAFDLLGWRGVRCLAKHRKLCSHGVQSAIAKLWKQAIRKLFRRLHYFIISPRF